MFKIDRPDPGDAGFSAGGQNIKWVEPKEEEVTSKQSAYVRSYFNDAYKNLNSPSKYSEFIDPLSWIDHHIFCEFIVTIFYIHHLFLYFFLQFLSSLKEIEKNECFDSYIIK